MDKEQDVRIKVGDLQGFIYVYRFNTIGSEGIYLASSKEDAEKEIRELFLDAETILGKTIPRDAIEVWSWNEYKEAQGMDISERLLEISY